MYVSHDIFWFLFTLGAISVSIMILGVFIFTTPSKQTIEEEDNEL